MNKLMTDSDSSTEPHIRVYSDRHEIHRSGEHLETHSTDDRSEAAKRRSNHIKNQLEKGYLSRRLNKVAESGLEDVPKELQNREEFNQLQNHLNEIVEGISPNQGRALAVHTVLLLAIKSIEPEQSIRLHKSSIWKEGLPMRGIDSEYIAREISDRDLVRVNRDGVMMTRTLAENLPYGIAYPAEIKGPQRAWGQVIETLEETDDGDLAEGALHYLLLTLHNRGEDARELNNAATEELNTLLSEGVTEKDSLGIIKEHIRRSPHAARLLEVALHSLYQPLDQVNELEGVLKPLTQMRSADQKHGNVADIEIVDSDDEFHIYEALDGKHGHEPMLREIKDLGPKLEQHPETEYVAFVTTAEHVLPNKVKEEQEQLMREHDVIIEFETLNQISQRMLQWYEQAGLEPKNWLVAYVQTLTHQRQEIAPIHEPTPKWVGVLVDVMENHSTTQITLDDVEI